VILAVRTPLIRKLFISLWLIALLCGISYLFWKVDWRYSLPTPVPIDYNLISAGDMVTLPQNGPTINSKPVFLHFFNPECPCSRFNMPHFKSLTRKYGEQIDFAVVVMSPSDDEKKIRDDFDIEVPVYFDKDVADACGVYSTPQAVLINNDGQLFYRGNYNKSRYCTKKEYNYAQMAIDSLLSNSSNLITDKSALTSYGCELPNCTK